MDRYVFLIPDEKSQPRGGIMNIVRHGILAMQLGVDVVLATYTGKDGHGRKWFHHDLPVIKWDTRTPNDVCVVPDIMSGQVDLVKGRCIVYQQNPKYIFNNFDYKRSDLRIWTDSPMMLEKCQMAFPDIDIPIVPNIIDNKAFAFKVQSEKKQGCIIVFPRKGDDFIKDVFKSYKSAGGNYWKPMSLNKLPFEKLAQKFEEAQAFLASADIEGCALPPQESLAAGVVVVGKNAKGANFSMQDGETALIANTVAEAVEKLFQAEDAELRIRIAKAGHKFISRYFPENEPAKFWRELLADW